MKFFLTTASAILLASQAIAAPMPHVKPDAVVVVEPAASSQGPAPGNLVQQYQINAETPAKTWKDTAARYAGYTGIVAAGLGTLYLGNVARTEGTEGVQKRFGSLKDGVQGGAAAVVNKARETKDWIVTSLPEGVNELIADVKNLNKQASNIAKKHKNNFQNYSNESYQNFRTANPVLAEKLDNMNAKAKDLETAANDQKARIEGELKTATKEAEDQAKKASKEIQAQYKQAKERMGVYRQADDADEKLKMQQQSCADQIAKYEEEEKKSNDAESANTATEHVKSGLSVAQRQAALAKLSVQKEIIETARDTIAPYKSDYQGPAGSGATEGPAKPTETATTPTGPTEPAAPVVPTGTSTA